MNLGIFRIGNNYKHISESLLENGLLLNINNSICALCIKMILNVIENSTTQRSQSILSKYWNNIYINPKFTKDYSMGLSLNPLIMLFIYSSLLFLLLLQIIFSMFTVGIASSVKRLTSTLPGLAH